MVPARVHLEWRRDGETVRSADEVEIQAHESSFRVWDALTAEGGPLPPGRYELILRTAGGRWLGRATLTLTGG